MKIEKLDKGLSEIRQTIINRKANAEAIASKVHENYRLGAKNLYRYLILRNFDLRKFQDTLSDLGVSSLRTAEGHVYSNLHHVIKNLKRIQDKPFEEVDNIEVVGYRKSKKLLRKHTNQLFGKIAKRRFTRIMVTLPLEAAEDDRIIRNMVLTGMDIARINLSHGTIEDWKKMVDIVHKVKEETGKPLQIYMDLSGPKIRTAPIEIFSSKGKRKKSIPIKVGDHVILTKHNSGGKKSVYNDEGVQVEKGQLGVLLPQIIDDVKIDDRVMFDDGMIEARVVDKFGDAVEVLIEACFKPKLSSNKGINLPDTQLNLPALTEKDIENLPFACQYADLLGYSFVRTGDDVRHLYSHLKNMDADHLGIVFKIENSEAFENLPFILFEGMRHNTIGVMIARGDLAVEIGFEKISEVQNEILWLCEAAHIPAIWATQVLENLAKTGIATRAEVSDAAQSTQSECVMLNKGPYILEAIKLLKRILRKMETHGFKKKSSLRPLDVAISSIEKLESMELVSED